MDHRKRRRCSESADDIKVCVPKKQNFPDVNISLQRSSSAPSFCTNKMESDKLQCVNIDQHDATSKISENYMKLYAPFTLPHVTEGINIPFNLPIDANNSSNENPCIINNPPIEVEDHLSNSTRVDTFKLALERIEELQRSLCDDSSLESDDEFDLKDHLEGILGSDTNGTTPRLDPQMLGFLMCAQETMKYLFEHGVKKDNPIVVNLRNRLIQGIQQI